MQFVGSKPKVMCKLLEEKAFFTGPTSYETYSIVKNANFYSHSNNKMSL